MNEAFKAFSQTILSVPPSSSFCKLLLFIFVYSLIKKRNKAERRALDSCIFPFVVCCSFVDCVVALVSRIALLYLKFCICLCCSFDNMFLAHFLPSFSKTKHKIEVFECKQRH